MKVMITGCRGQVGVCLVNQLSQIADIEVIALDSAALDIGNPEQVRAQIVTAKPDVIINAAAYTAVDKAESEPEQAYRVNAAGPGYLALAAKQINALFLHISTDYVFDGSGDVPYREDDNTNPKTVYGQTKLAGEQLVIESGCRYGIVRTAWVFGEHGHNFVKTMIKLADRAELNIVADQFGGPTYAGDIASALIIMMQKMVQTSDLASGIFHFSGAPHCSWYEFATHIFATAKSVGLVQTTPELCPIPSTAYPLPAQRPANSRLNCDRVYREFGIAPSDWQAALKQVLTVDLQENQV
ncbi:dTDP-4-dehydrorhamnose reductase [Shewanella sp. GXUN23E]|uniref:dTDP-4-dehydrorhamnose reductase n=1 Tax=Shewanella sp. GXUN23E TaxID=3422498 RepID=UPI003D7DA58C